MKKFALVLSVVLLSFSTLTACYKKEDSQDSNMSKKEEAEFKAKRQQITRPVQTNHDVGAY